MTGGERGRAGEDGAAALLESAGCRILARNYRTRYGEIDIIAADGPYIVFVEVKTRSGGSYGAPAEAVDARKRGRIVRAAQDYLMKHPSELQPRFDVVEAWELRGRLEYRRLENAFGV